MIAGIGRVMASGASSHDDFLSQKVVQSFYSRYGDGKAVEQCFTAGDRILMWRPLQVRPSLIDREYIGRKAPTVGVTSSESLIPT